MGKLSWPRIFHLTVSSSGSSEKQPFHRGFLYRNGGERNYLRMPLSIVAGHQNRGYHKVLLVRISYEKYSHGREHLIWGINNKGLVLEITTFYKPLEIFGSGALSCHGLLPFHLCPT